MSVVVDPAQHNEAQQPEWQVKAPQDVEKELIGCGIIPPRVIEELRLVKEEDPIHEELRAAIREIITPIATAEELELFERTKLRIAHIEKCFGFAIPEITPAIVGLDRAGLDPSFAKSPKNLDALLGLLIHEFAHVVFQEKYKHEENSKPEEGAADIVAVQILFERGYDPRAYLDFMRGMFDPNDEPSFSWRYLQRVLDPHPITATRLSYIAAEITRLEQQFHEIKVTPRPLPEPNPLAAIIPKIRHYSIFDCSTRVSRIHALTGFINTEEDWNNARDDDFQSALKALDPAVDLKDERTGGAISDLANAMLSRIERVASRLDFSRYRDSWVAQERRSEAYRHIIGMLSQYGLVSSLGRVYQKEFPTGKLSEVAQCAQHAVEAKEPKAQADVLEELTRKVLQSEFLISPSTREFSLRITWPAFILPRQAGEKVPWQDALQEGIERARKGSSDALAGLVLLGVEDPRIFPHLSNEWVLRYLDRCHWVPPKTLSDYPSLGGISKGDSIEGSFPWLDNGKGGERKEPIDVRNFKIAEDGTVLSIPSTWKDYWKQLEENTNRIYSALYREDLFACLNSSANELTRNFKHLQRMVGSLCAQYGPQCTLTGLENLLTDPDKFIAENKGILDDFNVQEAICQEIDRAASSCSSEEEFQKVRAVAEKFFSTPFATKLKRSGRESEEKKNGPGSAAPIAAIPPLERYQYTEQRGFSTRKDKIALFLAEMEHIPLKSERILYRPVFHELFPQISERTASWDTLIENVKRIYNELSPLFIDTAQDTERREWQERELKFNMAGIAELLIDVEAAGEPSIAQIAALLELTWSPSLADVDDLPSIRDIVTEILDRPISFSPSPLEAVKEWVAISNSFMLLSAERIDPEARKVFELEGWKELTPAERCNGYAQLLRSRNLSTHTLIQDIIRAWCSSVCEAIGKDDGTQNFQDKLKLYLSEIEKFSGGAHQHYAFSELADTLCLQQDAAKLCYDSASSLKNLFSDRSAGLAVGADISLDLLRHNAEARHDVMDFLCSPLDDKKTDALLKKYEEEFFMVVCGLETSSTRNQDRHRMERIAALQNWHRNFWALPLEARALAARELLLPSGKESSQSYEDAYTRLFSYICPEQDEHHKIASKFLRKYADGLPEHARPIFLGALLVAVDPGSSHSNRLGKSLALVAGALGPIENKVIQGAHSHHQTPEDIRVDLADSKTLIAEPKRWELFDIIEDALPAKVYEQIAHVGDVIGAASFFISVEVTLKDGRQVVLQLLRPNIVERAELGLKRLRQTALELCKEDEDFRVIVELCDEAERSFRSEINMAEAKLKAQAAQEMYDGTAQEVFGKHVAINTCSLVELADYGTAVGERWRMVSRVEGELFLRLAENPTPEMRKTLRIYGLALCAEELGNAAAGECMDDDWHAGNVFVNEHGLTRIDHGSITITRPSEQELTMLGRTLASALFSSGAGADPATAFLEEIRKLKREGELIPPLLRRFQKSLLSSAEYERFFIDGDRQWLLTRVLSRAHPAFLKGLWL